MKSLISFSNRLLLAAGAMTALLSAGCSTLGRDPAWPRPAQEPYRIAVLPMEDLSASAAPVNDIRRSLIAHVKLRGFDLLEDDQIEAFLEKNRIRSTSGIDAAIAQAWKEQAGVNAVLVTSCELYARNTIPKVALTARLVGTGTMPAVLWTDSIGLSGDQSPGLLGMGLIDDPALLAEKAADALAKSLAQSLSGQDRPGSSGKEFLAPGLAFRNAAAGLDLKEKTVSFVLERSRIDEGAGTARIALLLNARTRQPVTVGYAITGGTATGKGVDSVLQNKTVTFAPGDTAKFIELAVVDDSLYEGDETVQIALKDPVNAVLGVFPLHSVTIADNDPAPSVGFSPAERSVSESAGRVTIAAELSAVSGKDTVVPFFVSGTAMAGADSHLETSSPLVIKAGERSAAVSLAVMDDALNEPDETIVFSLGNLTDAVQGKESMSTITILDDDPLPAVVFALKESRGDESAGVVRLDVSLNAVSARPANAGYAITGGTATAGGVDYVLREGTVTFAPGETAKSIELAVVDDSLYEGDETVQVSLKDPENAMLGKTTMHTYAIVDNDPLPLVAFGLQESRGIESASPGKLDVVLNTASGRPVTVSYAGMGGTAIGGGVDYVLPEGTLTFAPGETSKSIELAVLDDSLYEGDETVQIVLKDPVNAVLGKIPVQTVTIADNDPVPSVGFTSAPQRVPENAGRVLITVKLWSRSVQDVVVPFTLSGTAIQGTDYRMETASPVVIKAGEQSALISLAVMDDALNEPDRTIEVALGIPTNAVQGMATMSMITILDNDPLPAATFLLPASRAGERAGVVRLDGALNAASNQPVTVGYAITGGTATRGLDYSLREGTVTFAPGETAKFIELAVVDDSLYEGDETVQIALKDPVNAALGTTAAHTVTIVENDPMPSVSFTPAVRSVPESAGTITITVELSGLSVLDVVVPFTVSGTATAGADYRLEAPSPVVIKAGERSAAISLAVMDHRAKRKDKTLDLTIERPTNAVLGPLRAHRLTLEARNVKPSVAVLTFFNESKRKNAGEILMLQFVKAFQKLNTFEVIEPGIVRMQLLNMRVVMDEGVSLADADLIYRNLDADLIVCGRVMEYQDYDYSSAAPQVDFSVEVIERRSSKVVWSSKSYHQGDEGVVLFGWPRVRTANALAAEMVRLIVGDLAKE